LKVPFPIASAVQSETQKINRLWAVSATLAGIALREASKFNEFGLRRFQSQAKLPQSLAQRILDTKGVRAILETQHKVVNVPHQIGLTP